MVRHMALRVVIVIGTSLLLLWISERFSNHEPDGYRD